jgi:LmbE family N-acetylglucosaminyl deacetylase
MKRNPVTAYLSKFLSARLRKSNDLFFRFVRHSLEIPEIVKKPAGSRILVFAPHPDDETLGCGGVLYRHHLAGDHITVIFMTQGEKGISQTDLRTESLVRTRKAEANNALSTLGVDDWIFLDFPDGSLAVTKDSENTVSGLIKKYNPVIIYTPFLGDAHRDHRNTSIIVASSLRQYREKVMIYMYEVWSPLPANCVVPINMSIKIQALRNYRTQLDDMERLVVGSKSLAIFRAKMSLIEDDKYGEAFMRSDRSSFVLLASDFFD